MYSVHGCGEADLSTFMEDKTLLNKITAYIYSLY